MGLLSPKTRYHQTTVNGRRRLAHRAVMETILGRELARSEYVHHKNGDKEDNRPENLEIMSPLAHAQHHHQILPSEKSCVICGQNFTPHKTKRRRQQTCGPTCKSALLKQRNVTRKLSDVQVAEIRASRASGMRLVDVAARYGITATQVSYIARGKSRSSDGLQALPLFEAIAQSEREGNGQP